MISTHEQDQQLLAQVCSGDTGAFGQLYQQYADATYQIALAASGSVEIAQDAVHDVFTRLLSHPWSFQSARNLKMYMLTASRNAAVNYLRKARRCEPRAPEVLPLIAGPASADVDQDDVKMLNEFLTELPAAQREVIVLKTYQELTFREIALVQDVSLSTVLSRYEYGMNKLREKFRHA